MPRGGLGQPFANPNFTQPRVIVPSFPPSASTNQQVLYALAAGTGGFPIFNTNDLLTGLQKIQPNRTNIITSVLPRQIRRREAATR